MTRTNRIELVLPVGLPCLLVDITHEHIVILGNTTIFTRDRVPHVDAVTGMCGSTHVYRTSLVRKILLAHSTGRFGHAEFLTNEKLENRKIKRRRSMNSPQCCLPTTQSGS
jgi:hypothetical protein